MTNTSTQIALTYNIHGGVGRDRRIDPWRIAAVINEISPDVAGLQEVTVACGAEPTCVTRTIERETGMHSVFHPTLDRGPNQFGNLLLTRWAVTAHRWVDLHVAPYEQRGAIVAYLEGPWGAMRVVVTHMGLKLAERRAQIERLRLSLADDGSGAEITLFLGDFNCWGASQRLLRTLGAPDDRRRRPRSFPASWPVMALDRVWSTPDHLVREVSVHRSPLARIASDHLPLVVRIDLFGAAFA